MQTHIYLRTYRAERTCHVYAKYFQSNGYTQVNKAKPCHSWICSDAKDSKILCLYSFVTTMFDKAYVMGRSNIYEI